MFAGRVFETPAPGVKKIYGKIYFNCFLNLYLIITLLFRNRNNPIKSVSYKMKKIVLNSLTVRELILGRINTLV